MLEQSQAKINMRFANSRDHLARPVIQYAVEIAPEVDETEASVKGICIDVSSKKDQKQGSQAATVTASLTTRSTSLHR